MMNKRIAILAGVCVAAAGVLAACGGEDADDVVVNTKGEGTTADSEGVQPYATAAATSAAARQGLAAATPPPPATGGGNAYVADGKGAPADAPAAIAALDRKIIFNSAISLGVNDLETAFNAVSRIAATYGGYIEQSAFQGGDASVPDSLRTASVTLRVPVETYNDALQSLRTLPGGKVKSESAKSTEVTEQYTDMQSRLRNLERTELQYLTLLGQAKTVTDILTMSDRLDAVRLQIEQVQGRLKVLDHLTSLASIDVALAPIGAAKVQAPKEGGPKGFSQAFADSWEWSLETARYVGVGVASVAAVAIWLAIPLALLAVAARFAGRRPHGPPAA